MNLKHDDNVRTKVLCARKNISLFELAHRLGITTNSVLKMKRQDFTVDEKKKTADVAKGTQEKAIF